MLHSSGHGSNIILSPNRSLGFFVLKDFQVEIYITFLKTKSGMV